jgi:hypothetical protein
VSQAKSWRFFRQIGMVQGMCRVAGAQGLYQHGHFHHDIEPKFSLIFHNFPLHFPIFFLLFCCCLPVFVSQAKSWRFFRQIGLVQGMCRVAAAQGLYQHGHFHHDIKPILANFARDYTTLNSP